MSAIGLDERNVSLQQRGNVCERFLANLPRKRIPNSRRRARFCAHSDCSAASNKNQVPA